MEPINMTVLIDESSCECLYVDGKRWNGAGETTVYVTDIVAEAAGRPMLLKHVHVERPGRERGIVIVFEPWPESLEEAKKWIKTEATATAS